MWTNDVSIKQRRGEGEKDRRGEREKGRRGRSVRCLFPLLPFSLSPLLSLQ
jgi:hypothetical protein